MHEEHTPQMIFFSDFVLKPHSYRAHFSRNATQVGRSNKEAHKLVLTLEDRGTPWHFFFGAGKVQNDNFESIFHGLVVPLFGTGWDRLGQVGLGRGGIHIGWDRWDWDRGVFRLGGTAWDWERSLFEVSLGQVWYRQRDCTMCLFHMVPFFCFGMPPHN